MGAYDYETEAYKVHVDQKWNHYELQIKYPANLYTFLYLTDGRWTAYDVKPGGWETLPDD
jgi:hypothetical protein